MEKSSKEFADWLGHASEDEKSAMKSELKKWKNIKHDEVKAWHEREKAEVESLRDRLRLLRGQEKSTPKASPGGNNPIRNALNDLTLARSAIVNVMQDNGPKTAEGSTTRVLAKGNSDMLVEIIKEIDDFVRQKHNGQFDELCTELNIETSERQNIYELQRTLEHDIVKALCKTYIETKRIDNINRTSESNSPYLKRLDPNIHTETELEKFFLCCIRLVWLVVLESPKAELVWEINPVNFRDISKKPVKEPVKKNSIRVLTPAIVITYPSGTCTVKEQGVYQEYTPTTKR